MWACPHCQLTLQAVPGGNSLACCNKHTFDRAREGYVNLLPANRRRSRAPGDSAEMLAARRRVHQAAAFQPLADALVDQLAGLEIVGPVLDLGCGEGYYCSAMAAVVPAGQLYGIDISRAAVRLAAKSQRTASFAVASAYQLPLLDASLDLVVRIFAPSEDEEVRRVLKPGGYYLELAPAPGHLRQLREQLYDRPREHAPARVDITGMCLRRRHHLAYRLPLNPELLGDIVAMTPFAHRGHREKRDKLLASGLAAVDMAFSLCLFQLGADR